MMFGVQFFANLERKLSTIFLKGIDNKIFDFKWINNILQTNILLYDTPSKKINKIFVSTTFAKNDSKISEVLLTCKKANISNIELGSNHCYEKNYKKDHKLIP